jgi:hypothetical protein
MRDDRELEINICHNGVHFTAPIRGHARYLKEKALLNDLVGRRYPAGTPRPVPDPTQDYYELDDEKMKAYSAFRQRMKEQSQIGEAT